MICFDHMPWWFQVADRWTRWSSSTRFTATALQFQVSKSLAWRLVRLAEFAFVSLHYWSIWHLVFAGWLGSCHLWACKLQCGRGLHRIGEFLASTASCSRSWGSIDRFWSGSWSGRTWRSWHVKRSGITTFALGSLEWPCAIDTKVHGLRTTFGDGTERVWLTQSLLRSCPAMGCSSGPQLCNGFLGETDWTAISRWRRPLKVNVNHFQRFPCILFVCLKISGQVMSIATWCLVRIVTSVRRCKRTPLVSYNWTCFSDERTLEVEGVTLLKVGFTLLSFVTI